MYNKGFTLIESVVVLCISSFLLLITAIRLPAYSSLELEMQYIKEQLIQTQLASILARSINEFEFTQSAFCTNHSCIPYAQGITSDEFTLKFYENGTISQAKTICFYKQTHKKCFYLQLGSGQIDIR